MKNFLKITLASLLAFIIGGVFLLLIGIGIIGSIAASGDQPFVVKNKSILEIKLNSEIVDRGLKNPFEDFDFMKMKPKSKIGLNDILNCIEKAKTDDKIKGIYLNISDIKSSFGGLAVAQEIRKKLQEFKATKKFVVAYSTMGYSQKGYYLASVADSVFINPLGNMWIVGLGGEMTFYKQFLKKIGVEAQIIRVGKYKSAVEPFFLDKMSDEAREQNIAYTQNIWDNMVKGISQERDVTVADFNKMTDDCVVRSAQQALKHHLIDGIKYDDEIETMLKKLSDTQESDDLEFVSINEYNKAPKTNFTFYKDKIAVIYATGEIGFEQSNSSIGPELANTIRKARKDSTIKAIVLRVNSPGGSPLTSDVIWREMYLASKVKPVIASMGNVAASGGYYISCAADVIVADPNTITGSIGIYGMFFSGSDLIKNKLGLTTDSYSTNKHSAFGGSYPIPFLPFASRKFNKFETHILQDYLDDGYNTFLERVAKGRHSTVEAIHKVAQGRVWSAVDAKAHGLVDELGGLETAIAIAKEKAGIKNCRIVELPEQKEPFQEMIKEFTGEVSTKILQSELGINYSIYKQSKVIFKRAGIQVRIPYDIDLN